MPAPTSRQRLSRFIRSRTPPPVQLTERDLRILDAVSTYRLLVREQIQRLLFSATGTTACKRRLMLLYQGGLLGRIPLPVRNAYGASRAVYFLERAGARLLTQVRDGPVLHERPRDLGHASEFFIEHTLDVNDVRVAFALSSARCGYALEWTDERELRRRKVNIALANGGATGLIPDGYFTISGPTAVDGFALEVDRGTVAEQRMRRRFAAYGSWAETGVYRSFVSVTSLRVIVAVTTGNARRLAALKRWCEDESGGSLFWFYGGSARDDVDILSSTEWRVAGEDGARGLPLSGL